MSNFSSCILEVVTEEASSIVRSSDGTWKTSSFYVDSSGRSRIALPLRLQFPSEEALDEVLATGSVHPFPSNSLKNEIDASGNQNGENARENPKEKRSMLAIEAKVTLTFGTGAAITATVEGVTILSTRVEQSYLHFDTEIIVRVTRAEDDLISGDSSQVKTNLEVTAVLSEESHSEDKVVVASAGLKALISDAYPVLGDSSRRQRIRQTRVTPISLHVALTRAFTMAVTSIGGPSMGQTLVSLTLRHSNTHTEPVTITNIALHPGHSRNDRGRPQDQHVKGGRHSVTDMSKTFQWGYAQKSEPDLPLTIGPHEAFSSIIVVKSTEDSRCQTFFSPISVTALVGRGERSNHRHSVVAASEVQWTTSRAAVEPADAFRVDMALQQMECTVGSPLSVVLNVFNLSSEQRDLMVLVIREEEKGAAQKKKPTRNLAISEQSGHKFGVWGLSSDGGDDIPKERDRELLCVDTALLLGEIKGHSSTRAELRFIPLQEGTLSIPNLTLVDKRAGQWYSCVHSLRIVSQVAS